MAWSKNATPEEIRAYNKKYYEEKTKAKRAEYRKNNPIRIKRKCPICGGVFVTDSPRRKYCSDACQQVATKMRNVLYRQTDKYKEYMHAYRQTDKYKEIKEKYRKSEKGQQAIQRYLKSEKGQQAIKRSNEKAKAKKNLEN